MYFFDCRLVVYTVNQRQRFFLQRLGGCDVGEDHALFDQPVRVEPLCRCNAVHRAVGLEQDFSLR